MYPYIFTPLEKLETFKISVALGVLLMVLTLYYSIEKKDRAEESAYIFPRLVVGSIIGFGFAIIFDSFFKFLEHGVLKIYGMAFYGGLLGASAVVYVILRMSKEKTGYSISFWFNKMTVPFMLFHVLGRIGCFLGGCCYGKVSDSIFAVAFPDIPEAGIIHAGTKCYPTQLFEAFAVLLLIFLVFASKRRYVTYLFSYSIVRFSLEFLRGDDRGSNFLLLSPSQLVALSIIAVIVIREILIENRKKGKEIRV